MIISPHEQRSEGWFKDRLGLPTASCFEKIVDTKGNPSKSRQKYLEELAGEVASGRNTDRYVSWDMKENAKQERPARLYHIITTGEQVREVGLCWPDELKKWGASPDGLIDPDGGLEIKGAKPSIQVVRLLKGWSKSEHFQQVQGCMYVCDRRWWKLISYCDGMDPVYLFYERDEAFIEKLRAELDKFCLELSEIIKKLKH